MSSLRVPYGLALDFTPNDADASAVFLTLDPDGSVTKVSSIDVGSLSGGGDLTEVTSSILTITGAGTLLAGTTIEVAQAGIGTDGYLSSADWNTFNNKLGTALTDAYLFVGNGSGVATGVAAGGVLALANDGTFSFAAGAIVNADINATAGIQFSKMEALSPDLVVVTDGSGFEIVSAIDTTHLGYLANLSGDLQASLDTLGSTIAGRNISSLVSSPGAAQNLYALVWDNTNTQWTLSASGGGGTLTGPGSSTINAVARWAGTGGDSVKDSSVLVDDSGNITGATSITVSNSGLHILDSSASFDLIVAPGSVLTSDRTLTLTTGDADRTLTISGSATIDDWFDQSVKTTADVLFSSLTLSNSGGLHVLDSDSSHDLIISTGSNLTADRTLLFNSGDADKTITIPSSGTMYVTGGPDVSLSDGGTGSSLSDPNYDAVFVWDDTSGLTRLAALSGLSYDPYTNVLTVTGGGITNGGAANEIVKSDGTDLDGTGIYSTSDGNLILGSASLSGGRTISVASNDIDANLVLEAQGAGNVVVNNRYFAIGVSNFINFDSQSEIMYLSAASPESSVFILSAAAGSASDGGDIQIRGGQAAGTNQNGGDVIISAGVPVGTGVEGKLIARRNAADLTIGGTVKTETSTVGNVGSGEDTLSTCSLPVSLLNKNNDSVNIKYSGTFAANTNGKELRLYLGGTGGTLFFDSGVITTVASAVSWVILVQIIRTGSSSQKINVIFQGDTSAGNVYTRASYLAGSENCSSSLDVVLTGEATSDNDIVKETVKIVFEPAE